MVKKINFHGGMVKGIAFDPAGELMTTQVGPGLFRFHRNRSSCDYVPSRMIALSAFGELQTGHFCLS
jgi:hypothetical protein